MTVRKFFSLSILFILIGTVFAGAVHARGQAAEVKAELQNVRAYAPVIADGGRTFAVDGGKLYAGTPGNWINIKVPGDVIVNAVALDASDPNLVYIGAGNELALYRSQDGGASWQRIPLSAEVVGAVTSIAVDSTQRLVYAASDTAGLFRLRDVGTSMILSGHLLVDEPVLEVVADSSGSGQVFARTAWSLYRAEDFGLRWLQVTGLGSAPTALAIAPTTPATIYVGTTDRGLLTSRDGLTWTTANEGLGMSPGTRLTVDALAIDPQQPEVLYVATSYLFGSTTLHTTPVGVAMSVDGAGTWQALAAIGEVAVAELLPVSGETGSVYAVTTASRTPLALGKAATGEAALAATPVDAPVAAGSPTSVFAWIVAGLALLALLFAVGYDVRRRMQKPAHAGTPAPSYIENHR